MAGKEVEYFVLYFVFFASLCRCVSALFVSAVLNHIHGHFASFCNFSTLGF